MNVYESFISLPFEWKKANKNKCEFTWVKMRYFMVGRTAMLAIRGSLYLEG
jgi:hypothetical protein